jgi:hypothetical protein
LFTDRLGYEMATCLAKSSILSAALAARSCAQIPQPGIAGKVDRDDNVSRTGAARNQRRLVAASPSSAAHTAGVIFWFIRKKLVGSYLALSSVSRR